jgi:hypothetical protein
MTNLAKTEETNDNNDLVVVHLDRPRFVRFGHKALKQLTKLTGKKLEQMDENDFDLADLEAIMWCGLQADAQEHGEVLKMEDMEDLLDKAPSFGDIMETMTKALEQAFKRTQTEKN